MSHAMLQPVVALLIWSLVIWLWLYATRLPAIKALNIPLDPNVPPKELMNRLPPQVRWKADNYNHLMEAPTMFYAAALTVALVDPLNATAIAAAWAYVGLRVAHSLVQCTVNHIPTRFSLFALSTLALALVIYQGAGKVFSS